MICSKIQNALDDFVAQFCEPFTLHSPIVDYTTQLVAVVSQYDSLKGKWFEIIS